MDMQLRMRLDLERMNFEMVRAVDLELDKRRAEIVATAAKVVKEFDFEKELRAMFEYQARTRIQDALRVEAGKAAYNLLSEWDIEITIKPKERPI